MSIQLLNSLGVNGNEGLREVTDLIKCYDSGKFTPIAEQFISKVVSISYDPHERCYTLFDDKGQEFGVNEEGELDMVLTLPGSGLRSYISGILAYLYDLMFIDEEIPNSEDIEYLEDFQNLDLEGYSGNDLAKLIFSKLYPKN